MPFLARFSMTFVSLAICFLATERLADADEPCRIEVIDRESGWPVPLVELKTISGLRFVSDNAGVIVVDEPELLGQTVWFHVLGQGYSVEKDGFGFAGVRLSIESGETLQVEVDRRTIAKRVGRLTGSGLFANHQRTSSEIVMEESGVVGCDSVQMTIHNDRLFWIWGDTNLAHYPLGVFHASGATTSLTPLSGSTPPLSMPFNYFRDEKQRPRGVANIPGRGPTWLSCLASLPDRSGKMHLVANYVKVEPPLTVWQRGLCEWNADTETFELAKKLWTQGDTERDQPAPTGHAVRWIDDVGEEWVLLGNPFPTWKFRASYEAWQQPDSWEKVESSNSLTSIDGEQVLAHSGSIAFSPFRNRWVTVFVETFGKPSALGEVWYAEAKSPFGPWGPAVKILSHQNYSFYNPKIHVELSPDDSAFLFFEGTYTVLFANATRDGGLTPSFPNPTPRYDYNQILYRLDLDSEALAGSRFED